jgi:hypothetical protein
MKGEVVQTATLLFLLTFPNTNHKNTGRFFLSFCCAGFEPRALCMLGRHVATRLHFQFLLPLLLLFTIFRDRACVAPCWLQTLGLKYPPSSASWEAGSTGPGRHTHWQPFLNCKRVKFTSRLSGKSASSFSTPNPSPFPSVGSGNLKDRGVSLSHPPWRALWALHPEEEL